MINKDDIKIFNDEIYSISPKKIYPIIEIINNHIAETSSINLRDTSTYKVSNKSKFRYILVLLKKLSKYTGVYH